MSRPRRELGWEGRTQVAHLAQLAAERDRVDDAIKRAVRKARSRPADVPWSVIGETLGLTATGAQARYRDVAPKVRNRRPSRIQENG